MIKLIECPRDAMQGLPHFIPTAKKINYLNQLLKVGFDTLDFGSFVSAKAIPQMQDTEAVLKELDLAEVKTKLLAIIANVRGAQTAASFPAISYLGFPLSLSETFQIRNTNKSIAEAFTEIAEIQEICIKNNKILVVYLSMGFGNPYQDLWHPEIAAGYVEKLQALGINIISLADTVGVATPENIKYIFTSLLKNFSAIDFGAHFHSRPDNWEEKIEAAYTAGCQRFDGALKGFGGCPMANDELVGNLATENLIAYFENKNIPLELDKNALNKAFALANSIFL